MVDRKKWKAIRGRWHDMMGRCYKPTNTSYPRYGGRGITVCERWHSFDNFYADTGDPPDGMTIDRIDNDGNYEPGNVRWATKREQSHNQSTCHYIEYNGERKLLTQWALELGMTQQTLSHRLRLGWDIERALATPVHLSYQRNSLKGHSIRRNREAV